MKTCPFCKEEIRYDAINAVVVKPASKPLSITSNLAPAGPSSSKPQCSLGIGRDRTRPYDDRAQGSINLVDRAPASY